MTESTFERHTFEAPKAKPVLWLVVPCFNEEQVLPKTAPLFLREIDNLIEDGLIDASSRILFVNDGSSDATWEIIADLHTRYPAFEGLSLSRNRGHQNALLAGLMETRAYCDIAVSIDCDGQDDISVLGKMVQAYLHGNDIVYGVRNDRESDTAFKRTTAKLFYSLMNALGAETIANHADYRLMSKRALDALAEFEEVNLFLRGLVPLVGFKSTTVTYSRRKRLAGESKYPSGKMIGLAVDGITSFSIKPVRIIGGVGIVIGLLGLIGLIWAVIRFCMGATVSGWASLFCAVLFLGGIQIFSIGVIGEYIGKMYLETKSRPRYIIDDATF